MVRMQDDRGFCWLDGSFHRENETPVKSGLFRNGMVVREVVRTLGTRLAFFPEHYEHLRSRLEVLNLSLPAILPADEMQRYAVNLINKNRYFGGNGLYISILIETGAARGTSLCLMECTPLEQTTFELNRKGYVLGLYDDLNVPLDRLSGFFSRPPVLDYFAQDHARAKGWDDCILFNQQGNITGTIGSALFFRIRNKLHTPPLKDGAPSSIWRKQAMQVLAEAGDPVNDTISLRGLDIGKADEIFLVNALDGVRWVVAVERSRYFNQTGARLIPVLNEKAFEVIN
jgi:branched-chain amino acid aminotransferase